MLNSFSNATAAAAASNFLRDASRRSVDEQGHGSGSGLAKASSIDQATQTDPTNRSDEANALFKKIYDDEEAWLDPHERTLMLNVMAAVSLEMKGFDGVGVVVHQGGAADSLPADVERPRARVLHVFHAERSAGKKLDVMVGITEDVGRHRRHPPMGWSDFSVGGVAKALCTALVPVPTGQREGHSPGDVEDFERSLRSHMRRVAEDDPEKFLRLSRRGARKA